MGELFAGLTIMFVTLGFAVTFFAIIADLIKRVMQP